MRKPPIPLAYLLRLLTQSGKLVFRVLMILLPVVGGAIVAMLKHQLAQGIHGPETALDEDRYYTGDVNNITHPDHSAYWDRFGNPL